MFKKILLLSSFVLLAGCNTDTTEETPDENGETPPTEVEESNIEETDLDENEAEEEAEEDIAENEPADEANEESNNESSANQLANFIHEDTFMDPYAYQAWEDYQQVIADATYGEITYLHQENPDISQLEGLSQSEIDDRFSALDLREDVFSDSVEVNESEEMHFYRYPAEEGSELSEISDFLAELTFYYVDDNLVYSSITPGLYEVELNDLPETEILMSLLTVSEIEELNPQVFTIAEMKINDQPIQQIMVPSTHINEEGNEETAAFYFFVHGENIIQYAYLPFELVMQSFPDNSIMIYQQLIPELQAIDLGESI